MEPNDTLPRGDWWEGKIRDSYGIPRIVLPDNAVLAISDLVVAETGVDDVFSGDTLTAIRLALTEVIRAAAHGALDGLLVPVPARTAFGDAADAEEVAHQIASEARSQSAFPNAAGAEATRGAELIVENVIEHVTAHLIALPPEPFAFAL